MDIAAPVPRELQEADVQLIAYGRWATANSRGGAPATLDRAYRREADPKESLEAFLRRRAHVPSEPLMTARQAMRVQRALVAVPAQERVVLHALYIPGRGHPNAQLRRLGVSPEQSRERHLAGLSLFARLLAQQGSA